MKKNAQIKEAGVPETIKAHKSRSGLSIIRSTPSETRYTINFPRPMPANRSVDNRAFRSATEIPQSPSPYPHHPSSPQSFTKCTARSMTQPNPSLASRLQIYHGVHAVTLSIISQNPALTLSGSSVPCPMPNPPALRSALTPDHPLNQETAI